MFQLSLLLVAVTAAVTADTTTRTTTTPWTTTTHRTTTYYVPGCESSFTYPSQHALGESWHEQFEGFCQDCVCQASGKVCVDCPPRGCYRPAEYLMMTGHDLAPGESVTIEVSPGYCVLCHCQDYWANCNSAPCDGIIT